jgi:hypothetical protein
MLAVPAIVASLWLAAAPGKAPTADETRLFDEGMRAFQAGNPREADKAWRAGFALGKDPAFLVRMGEAEEKAGQPAEAADSYRRYLRAAPDAADRTEIEQRIARLAPAGDAAAAAGASATTAGAPETPGAFGAGATASGTVPGAAAATPATPTGSAAPARDDETANRPGADDEERGWTPYNITAWVATGASVLLLGVSGYYAASAGSSKDDVNQLLRYQNPETGAPLEYQNVATRYQNAISAGQRDDRRAKDALYVAAGAAVVATTFFILDSIMRPEEPHARREPVRPRQAGPQVGLQIAPARTGEATGATAGALAGVSALSWLRWSF